MATKGTKPQHQKLPSICDHFVENVGRPTEGAKFYYDRSRSGFGVKIYCPTQTKGRNSARVYGIRVTIEGNSKRWITIGAHGAPWNAKSARTEALAIRRNIENGLPPFAHRGDRKAALYCLNDLADAFFDELQKRVEEGERSEDTFKRYKRQWDDNVPKWLKKKLITQLKPSLFKQALREISRLKKKTPRLIQGHRTRRTTELEPSIVKGALRQSSRIKKGPPRPIEGNRTLAMISAMLGWTLSLDQEDRMGLTENHCLKVKRNKESTTRGIWIEDQDQAKMLAFLLDPANRYESWWEAERRARHDAEENGVEREELRQPPFLITNQAANALLLLFMTGLRSWEVMALRWDELHYRSKSISVLQTKCGANPSSSVERKRILVTDEVQEILDLIPETSEWIFPSKGRGKKASSGHIENLQDSWERVRAHLNLPKVRLHDFRHTAASEVGDDKQVSAPDLQASFGWKTIQTAMRYWHSRARARDEKVQDATTNRISRIKATDTEDDEQDSKGRTKPSSRGKGGSTNSKRSAQRLDLGKVTATKRNA